MLNKGETLIGELQYEGCRMTPLRRAMIEIFYTYRHPLSSEDLQEILKKRRMTPHKVSLYRELQFLEEWRVIIPVNLDDGRLRYELKGREHHHHVVCTKCRTVQDVPLDETELLKEKKNIEKKTQFTIIKHSLEFFGLCAKCR